MVGDVASPAIREDPCLDWSLGRWVLNSRAGNSVLNFAQGMDLQVELNHYKMVVSSTCRLMDFVICDKGYVRHLLSITYAVG